MADTHNEIAAQVVNGDIIQAGTLVYAQASRPEPPPVASWDDLPPLTPALQDLLSAQLEATGTLPYKLLGVRQPKLSTVYVRQHVRPAAVVRTGHDDGTRKTPETPRKPFEQHRGAAEQQDRPIDVTAVLSGGEHVLIEGPPGAGKSTLGHMYAHRLSDFWLNRVGAPPAGEPLLPVRIPARALAGNGVWSELIAAGARDAFQRRLTAIPSAELFARRALGARWLVFIDGLDEIAEAETRGQVISAIAHQIRRATDHRLVITSRPLPDVEFTELVAAGAVRYSIRPFGPDELTEFAFAWFREQDSFTSSDRARHFIRQIGDARLRGLVRNPLLATIAAISATLHPGRRLPTSRVDLYATFMQHLLDRTAAGRDTLAELRRVLSGQPERLRLTEWMGEQQVSLIERLAAHRVESDDSLNAKAAEWVEEHQKVLATGKPLPAGWREDLSALLTGTGIFVRTETDLRFLHHSFAEFLAARLRAREASAEPGQLEDWIARGLAQSTQSFVLFTLALWSREGQDLAPVFRTLLNGDAAQVRLAGMLLAEGVPGGADHSSAVVERIIGLLLARGVEPSPQSGAVTAAVEVLASLGAEQIGEPEIERLRRMRDRPDIPGATRIDCALTLGYLLDPEDAARWLDDYARSVDLPAIEQIITGLTELLPDGADRAEKILDRIAAQAGDGYAVPLAVVAFLLRIGRAAAAARWLRSVVERLRADPATEHTLTVPGHPTSRPGVFRVLDSWDNGVPTWGEVATLAARTGCAEETLWVARKVLDRPSAEAGEVALACEAMIDIGGTGVVTEVVDHARRRPVESILAVAKVLQRARQPEAVISLARSVLDVGHGAGSSEIEALELLAADRVIMPEELRELVFARLPASFDTIDRLSEVLMNAGQPDGALELAWRVVDDPAVDAVEFWSASRRILRLDGEPAARRLAEKTVGRSTDFWAQLVPELYRAGHEALGSDLLERLKRAVTEPDRLIEVASELQEYGATRPARELAGEIVDWVQRDAPDDRLRLAHVLYDTGQTADAVLLAQGEFDHALVSDDYLSSAVEVWLEAGGAQCAQEIVRRLLAVDTRAPHRLEVGDLFAATGLVQSAAAVWLDVLTHHGDRVEDGVAAASRLVKCGFRDEGLTALRDELRNEALASHLRVPLQAVLGWLTFVHPDADLAALGVARA